MSRRTQVTGSAWERIWRSRFLRVALRVGVGLVFIYASVDKIAHPDQFAEVMQDYELLPLPAVNVAAIWLAWLELVLGVLLVAGVWVGASALMVTGLTMMFIAAIAVALTRGIDLHCGCFSTQAGGNARTWTSLWQEGLLLLACLWVTADAFRDGDMAEASSPPSTRPAPE